MEAGPCLRGGRDKSEFPSASHSLLPTKSCTPPSGASTSPVSVQDKVWMKPPLALKAAAKGEKFSISSISSKRDFFFFSPSHLVTAVFRKITELMVLLPGTCTGMILLTRGGKASVDGPTQHRLRGEG